MAEPTNITQELWQDRVELLTMRPPRGHLPVRLLGVGVSSSDSKASGLMLDEGER